MGAFYLDLKKDLLFQYINVITIGKLKIASSSMMILFK